MTPLPRILLITDRTQVRTSVEEVVQAACGKMGCGWVLFRERDMEPAARRDMARTLREVTRGCKAKFSVSASAVLAAEVGAEGVHLQRVEDLPEARAKLPNGWIGVSAHSVRDVHAAHAAGADYVTLSPIFPSESKPGYGPPLGLESIRQAAEIGIPILALGGVTPKSAHSCIEAGAHGLAVMGTVMRAKDPGRCIRDYAAAFARSSARVE